MHPPVVKPRLGFWQLFNMNYGFFGIQFGWGLQLANMSAVYERLGAPFTLQESMQPVPSSGLEETR